MNLLFNRYLKRKIDRLIIRLVRWVSYWAKIAQFFLQPAHTKQVYFENGALFLVVILKQAQTLFAILPFNPKKNSFAKEKTTRGKPTSQ